jgi:hypothetical protein
MAYIGHEFYYDGTRATFFGYICTALINMGWELHDDIDADTKVYKSNGESGNEPYGYIYIDAGTSTYIQFAAYQYWNETTHTGVRRRYSADSEAQSRITATYIQSTQPAFIGGDKDFALIMSVAVWTGATNYVAFGHVKRMDNSVPINAHGTAGTAGTLTVATTAGLGFGQRVQITGSGCLENLEITGIPDSSTIVVNNLRYNYGTGAKLGSPVSSFGITNGVGYQYFYPCCTPEENGTAGTSTFKYTFTPIVTPGISNFLFFNEKKYILMPLSVLEATYQIALRFSDYFKYGVSATDRDVMIANNDGSLSTASTGYYGTASSATVNTLIDSSQAWGTNFFAGKYCTLTAGTAGSSVKKITGNDATSLTMDSNWNVVPVGGSTVYILADNVNRYLANTFTSIYALITSTVPPS